MFFRNICAFLVTVGILGSLVGCDRFLRSSKSAEDRAADQTVTIKSSTLGCLKTLPLGFQHYLRDESNAEEVEQNFQCLNKALDLFVLFTKEQTYTDDQLRGFFNRYLLKQQQISPEFMAEIMKLKAFVIGGSNRTLSKSEIAGLQKFLSTVKEEVQKLRGNVKMLILQETPEKITNERFDQVQTLARAGFLRLVNESKAAGSLYEFADFKVFVDELAKFMDETKMLTPFVKWMPLLESLKDLFLGERAQIRTSRDWRGAAAWGIDAYFLGLEYFYGVRTKTDNLVQIWSRFLRIFDRSLSLLERSPVLLREGRLESTALDRVLESLWAEGLKPMDLDLNTVKKTYRMAALRFLEHNNLRQTDPSQFLGLDQKHLSILRFEYSAWRMGQETILQLFQDRDTKTGVTIAEIKAVLGQQEASSKIQSLQAGDSTHDLLLNTWKQWKSLLTSERPLQWTISKKVLMQADPQSAQTSFQGLSWMNLLRTMTRFVQRGYGEGNSLNVWDLKISKDNLVFLENDFHELGMEVKLLDPRSKNPAARTFQESNFFTYSGNGDDYLTGQELLEELSLMTSGGSVITSEIMNVATYKKGPNELGFCEIGKTDILAKPIMRADCVEKIIKDNFDSYFEGLPGMVSLVREIKARDAKNNHDYEWKKFYRSLMGIAEVPGKTPDTTEYAEIRTAVVVLHYVESLMMVYDTNRNGHLDQQELLKASPRFGGFIAKMSPLGGYLLDDVFLCIVYKGKKPGFTDMAGFMLEKPFGLGEVGRLELVNVLAVLKKTTPP